MSIDYPDNPVPVCPKETDMPKNANNAKNPMTHHDDKSMGCCEAMAHLAEAMCACCCQEESCTGDEGKAACCACKESILEAMRACLVCIEACCGTAAK